LARQEMDGHLVRRVRIEDEERILMVCVARELEACIAQHDRPGRIAGGEVPEQPLVGRDLDDLWIDLVVRPSLPGLRVAGKRSRAESDGGDLRAVQTRLQVLDQ